MTDNPIKKSGGMLNIGSMANKKTKVGKTRGDMRKRVIELFEKKKPTKLELELAQMYLTVYDTGKTYTKKKI